jgi:hypothetical protein
MRGVDLLWRIAILVLMAVATASCHSGPGGGDDAVEGGTAASPDQFVDGAWELRVDRAWPTIGGNRSNQLVDSDYQPVSDGSTYPILVSDRGSQVTIDKAHGVGPRLHFPLKGSRTPATEAIAYDLHEGTFAGGRFVVWSDEQTLQAELTIYGSGFPIVLSVRGRLARRP